MSRIKFVGLHAHSLSIFDSIGYPSEHYDSCYENGGTSLAITDHGHMNAVPYQISHSKIMNDNGKSFKPLFGAEMYFNHSILEWAKERDKFRNEKSKKKIKKTGVEIELMDSSLDEENSLVIEDENTSKSEIKNVLNERRHLILLAQNQVGLNNLYKLVSLSYTGDNFYRFPRIDFDLLKKYNDGLICLTACQGGPLFGCYWKNMINGKDAIYKSMVDLSKQFLSIFQNRFYGELQWNSSKDQMIGNQMILDVAKDLGFKTVSTCDSHYPKREQWLSRILYKKLGWLNKNKEDKSLPDNIDDVRL